MKSIIAMTVKQLFALISIFFLSALFGSEAMAWPTTGQWIPIYRGGMYLEDANGDANGSRNVVSDANNPAAYMFNDGTYIHFRLRLDADPSGQGGQG